MAHYTCVETCRYDIYVYVQLILRIWLVPLTEYVMCVYLLILTGIHKINQSRGSSVSIVTRLWDGWSGVRMRSRGKRFFFCPNHPDRVWGPPSLLFNAYRVISGWGGAQWSGGDVDHIASTAELKNEWSYTGAPPICLHCMKRDSSGCNSISVCVSSTVDVRTERKTTVGFSLFCLH